MALTNVGLFFFRPRFLSSLKLHKFFSFCSMKEMVFKDNVLTINGSDNKKPFSLVSNSLPEIVSALNGTYMSIYGQLRPDLQNAITSTNNGKDFVYKSRSLLIDRIMGHYLKRTNFEKNGDEEFKTLIEQIYLYKDALVVNSLVVSRQYIESVLYALMRDQHIKWICFEGLDMAKFLGHLSRILSSNRSIVEVKFSLITFNYPEDSLVSFNKTRVVSPLTRIVFSQCELSSYKFINFFISFSKLRCRINTIRLDGSNFSPDNLNNFFILIFHSPYFQDLQEFALTGILYEKCVLDILSDFSTRKRYNYVRIMEFEILNIPMNLCLKSFSLRDEHITSIALKRANFMDPLTAPFNNLRKLSKIDISGARLCSESLVSFFQLLVDYSSTLKSLVLDKLQVQDSELNVFYKKMIKDNHTFKNIVSVSWENNKARDEGVKLFFRFLFLFPNLADLAMSNSISTQQKSLDYLIDFVRGSRLKRFVLRGGGVSTFGSEFLDVIKALAEIEILALDISGQNIGDRGLDALAALSRGKLSHLFFDDINPLNVERLYDFLMLLINLDLSYCEWPQNNIDFALKMFASSDSVRARFENLRNRFVEKYPQTRPKSSLLETSSLPEFTTILAKPSSLDLKIDMLPLTRHDVIVQDFLGEIFKDTSLSNDIMYRTIERMCMENNIMEILG